MISMLLMLTWAGCSLIQSTVAMSSGRMACTPDRRWPPWRRRPWKAHVGELGAATGRAPRWWHTRRARRIGTQVELNCFTNAFVAPWALPPG